MGSGRPRKELEPEQVRKLAGLHCSVDEIADILGCGRDTIYRHYKEELDRQGRRSNETKDDAVQVSAKWVCGDADMAW